MRSWYAVYGYCTSSTAYLVTNGTSVDSSSMGASTPLIPASFNHGASSANASQAGRSTAQSQSAAPAVLPDFRPIMASKQQHQGRSIGLDLSGNGSIQGGAAAAAGNPGRQHGEEAITPAVPSIPSAVVASTRHEQHGMLDPGAASCLSSSGARLAAVRQQQVLGTTGATCKTQSGSGTTPAACILAESCQIPQPQIEHAMRGSMLLDVTPDAVTLLALDGHWCDDGGNEADLISSPAASSDAPLNNATAPETQRILNAAAENSNNCSGCGVLHQNAVSIDYFGNLQSSSSGRETASVTITAAATPCKAASDQNPTAPQSRCSAAGTTTCRTGTKQDSLQQGPLMLATTAFSSDTASVTALSLLSQLFQMEAEPDALAREALGAASQGHRWMRLVKVPHCLSSHSSDTAGTSAGQQAALVATTASSGAAEGDVTHDGVTAEALMFTINEMDEQGASTDGVTRQKQSFPCPTFTVDTLGPDRETGGPGCYVHAAVLPLNSDATHQ